MNKHSIQFKHRCVSENSVIPRLQTLHGCPFVIRCPNTLRRAKLMLRGVLAMQQVNKNVQEFGTHVWRLDISSSEAVVSSKEQIDSKSAIPVAYARRCVSYPESKFQTWWNLVLFFLILYVITVSPWVIAFEEFNSSSPFYFTDLVVDLGFIADFLITLNTAFFDKEGKLVTSRRRIFVNYLKGMMIIDALSIFPFHIVLKRSSFGRSSTMLRVIRVLRIVKIVRASKMPVLLSKLNEFEAFEPIIRFIKTYKAMIRLLMLLGLVVVMAHITACMWFFTARIDDFNKDTWVARGNFDSSDKGRMYLASLYWAFTIFTTVGFGDIHAFTNLELLLCIVWMFLGVFFYSFIVSTLTSLLSSFDLNTIKLNECLRQVAKFGVYAKLPSQITSKLKKKIKSNFRNDSINQSYISELFSKLPSALRYEVAITMHNFACSKIRLFEGKSEAFVSDVIARLVYRRCNSKYVFFNEGDFASGVYLLIEGSVVFIYGDERQIFKEINSGSYFGEVEIIKKKIRKFCAAAKEQCEYFEIGRDTFVYILEAYPSIRSEINCLAKERDKRMKIFLSDMKEKERGKKREKKRKSLWEKVYKGEQQVSEIKERLEGLTTTILKVRERIP